MAEAVITLTNTSLVGFDFNTIDCESDEMNKIPSGTPVVVPCSVSTITLISRDFRLGSFFSHTSEKNVLHLFNWFARGHYLNRRVHS